MSDTVGAIDKESTLPGARGKRSTSLWIAIVLGGVVILSLFAGAYKYLDGQQVAKEKDLERLQQAITRTRSETVNTWISTTLESSRRLVRADIFRLFAAEMDNLPEGVPLLFSNPSSDFSGKGDDVEQLSSQLPLMQNLLNEFVRYAVEFDGARIMTSKGDSYLATESMRPVTIEQIELSKKAVQERTILHGPLLMSAKGNLSLDLYIPIYPSVEKTITPVAILIVTASAMGKVAQVLSPGDYQQPDFKLRLVQSFDSKFEVYIPEDQGFITLPSFALNKTNEFPFKLRESFVGKGPSYMYGYKVPSLDWWIVAEHKQQYITIPIQKMSKAVYAVTTLVSLIVVLCFLAAWWWGIGRRQGEINKEFQELLVVIDDQKKLLNGINSTISDPISLTDEKGRFIYVNKAFATVVGRDEKACEGLDGQAVFGFDTAKRLNISDQHVLMSGESITVNEVLWLQSKRYYFQISKTPLKKSENRTAIGIVSVFRDITQLVEAEKRSHRVVQQTIDALVSTIEQADPFLGGHSRIMGRVASLVARQLGLTESDVATIEAAANLSQVGKMFVPREILLKPGALTPDEKHEMERHVEHAYNVLQNIEFDLPVLEAISQMGERPDGKGYPKHLAGDQISVYARVLAVANAFAAMARPRSYRPALPIKDVISILEKDSGTMFDPNVVAALREVLTSPAGEKLAEQAASAKAV